MAMPAPPHRSKSGGDEGFILVVVLWLALLLAMFAGTLTASTNLHLQATRNSVEQLRVEWLALAGIRLALLDQLSDAENSGSVRFAPGAEAVTCRMPEGELLRLTLTNEAGKVDLNAASDELLLALVTGTGVDRETSLQIVDRIADWRDGDETKRANGAETNEYLAAGRSIGPKNAAFDSVLELANVLGIDGAVFARLRPHLTVHSGTAGIDPRHTSSELLRMLAGGDASASGKLDREGLIRQVPPRFITPSATAKALTVRSDLTSPAGTRVAIDAVVTREERIAANNRRAGPAEPLPDNIGRARPGIDNRSGRGPMVPGFRIWQLNHLSDLPGTTWQDTADFAVPAC